MKYDILPLIPPATITIATVNKLTVVNILFNKLDSLTPIASSNATNITIMNEKKSGYEPKKLILIGNNSLSVFSIV